MKLFYAIAVVVVGFLTLVPYILLPAPRPGR